MNLQEAREMCQDWQVLQLPTLKGNGDDDDHDDLPHKLPCSNKV